MKEIFKVGDTVYSWKYPYLSGKVKNINSCGSESYPVTVDFGFGHICNFTLDGKFYSSDPVPTLSFTPYDFIKGGFSQERPKPNLIPGKSVIYVKARDQWFMKYFASWINGYSGVYTYPYQQKSGVAEYWEEYSLTNPLIENE